MSKFKSILFWSICYVLSLVFFLIVFPISIFITVFPLPYIFLIVYVSGVAFFSVFAFRKGIRQSRMKRVLFVFLLVPMIAYIAILISIGMGWLQWL